MLRVFRGWWIVASGAVIQMLIAGLINQIYGAYVVLIQREFGWSTTTLSAVYSLFRVESGLLGPPQGWLLDRFGPRPVMRVGMIFLGGGFLALSQIERLATFFLCFVMIAVGASFAGYISICVTLVNWFHKRKAQAISTASMGFAVGGFIVPLVIVALERWGWRATAFATGLIFLTVGLLLTRPFWTRPEDCGCTVDGVPEDAVASVADGPHITVSQAITTPAFWTLSLGHASALFLVSAISVHLIPHLIETLGFTLRQAGFAVMAMTAMQFAGLAFGGFIGDRFDNRLIAIICMFMHGAGLLCLAFATSWLAVGAFAVLHGLAWGGRGPLMQAMRADYFGRRAYGMIAGYSSLVVTLGTSGGPILAGVLFDYFGDYQRAFASMSVFALVGAAMFWLARPPRTSTTTQRR
jgi:MFS family permease